MAAHQAPPSLGFSRQEHGSGLPFPSPMHESEKWKWSRSVVSDSSDPMECSPPGSSVHRIFQAKVVEWGAISSHQTEQAFNPIFDSKAYALFPTLRSHPGCFSDLLAQWFLWFQALDRVFLFSFWKYLITHNFCSQVIQILNNMPRTLHYSFSATLPNFQGMKTQTQSICSVPRRIHTC